MEQGHWDEAERLLHSVEWLHEKFGRGTTIEQLKLRIRIYRGKGTLHEHLDVYDRLVEELEYSAREQAATSLATIGLQKKLREIEELREVSTAFKALLPGPVYAEFRSTGEAPARFYPETAIFFSDFVGFTRTSSALAPRQVMEELTDLFANFDRIMAARGCERIETIGDAYVAVSGLTSEPEQGENGPAVRLARAALDIQDYLGGRNSRADELGGPKFEARMGLHLGGSSAGSWDGTESASAFSGTR